MTSDSIEDTLFGFTIKWDWVAWSILVADTLDNTVAWASWGVDDPLIGTKPLNKLLDTGLIQSDGKLWFLNKIIISKMFKSLSFYTLHFVNSL